MAQTSVYRRVFTPFVIAISTGSILAWWIATTLLINSLEARVQEQSEHALSVLADGRFPLTQDLLDELAYLQNTHFALIDKDGRIALRSDGLSELTWRQAIAEQAKMATTSVRTENGFLLHIRALDAQRARPDYAAIAGLTSTDDLQNASANAALALGAIAAFSIMGFAWWGHRISLSLTRPINELVFTAQNIAAGARSAEPHTTAIREVARLDLAINEMARQLQDFERDMEEQSRLKGLGELAAHVAHEIRNPLTAMKLQVQLLCENNQDTETSRLGDQLLSEIERLQLVVDNALSLGRPLETKLSRGDLNAVVSEVLDLLEAQLKHRQIDVHTQLNELPSINLDANRIKQVIFNLVINAADALPTGGRISVSSGVDGDFAKLTVEDSGPGFSRESQPDEQQRPKRAKPNGLGLGLRISDEIVSRHGGQLSISSSASLGGASITIKLPSLAAAHQNATGDRA